MDVFNEEIRELRKDEGVEAILLVGSALDYDQEKFDQLKDVDLFVIIEGKHDFEREILEKRGMNFDISYISLHLLRRAIKERWPFVINGLSKYKILYKKSDKTEGFLNEIQHIYFSGPNSLKKEEIEYIRFKLYESYEDLLKREKSPIDFLFLSNQLLKEILIGYFKLNRIWIPKDKKILQIIYKKDQNLYNLCQGFIMENKIDEKIEWIEKILNHTLTPFGGILKYWNKGKFPLI